MTGEGSALSTSRSEILCQCGRQRVVAIRIPDFSSAAEFEKFNSDG